MNLNSRVDELNQRVGTIEQVIYLEHRITKIEKWFREQDTANRDSASEVRAAEARGE